MARVQRPIGDRRAAPRGQAMVEMALVVPIFLLVLFGLIDVGRLVSFNSMVSQAAREGARVAAVEADWLASSDASCKSGTNASLYAHVCPANDAALAADVLAATKRELFGLGVPSQVYVRCTKTGSPPPTGTWTGTTCFGNSHSTGDSVSVRVMLPFNPITPIASSFFGSILGPITVVGAATMVINWSSDWSLMGATP